MSRWFSLAAAVLVWASGGGSVAETGPPLAPGEGDVLVRIIDVGAGHAAVARIPGGHYLVYDAGHWAGGGATAFAGVSGVVPGGEDIDLMVLSHSDADHLAAVDEILDAYRVRTLIRSGHRRSSDTWKQADAAIRAAEARGETRVIDLSECALAPGSTYRFGEAFVTMVAGFSQPPKDWVGLSPGDRRNAGSIVIRLAFKGGSVLFTGDAVGRHIGDPADALIASEKFMVDKAVGIPIDSDVLVAPHHGADNASSTAFIEAVSPEWVIFPAGHKHEHPRATTAKRYIDAEVDVAKMLRTDRGDDEGAKEWDGGRGDGKPDRPGDDDIDIVIRADGRVEVAYRVP